MHKTSYLLLVVAAGAGCFLAGRWPGAGAPASAGATSPRRILYYHDPMHPAYKSDKPGIAPDCGMQLEPVYAGEEAMRAALPPGGIRIIEEKQRTIGVRTEVVDKAEARLTIRAPGRVSFDETQVYRLTTATDGWIRSILPVTVGAVVKKGDLLATFYSREFLTSQQSYFYALNTRDRFKKSGTDNAEQIELTNAQIRSSEENLQAQGMTDTQIQAIAAIRKPSRDIEIRAPAAGLVTVRNVFPGLRFDRGAELFRIADLRRVWILTDLFETDARLVRPGVVARVTCHGRTFNAVASSTVPQFDPATRTLKLRLETDNPGMLLRPDMFVDVEIPVHMAPALSIPADAIIDSGTKQIVYVDRGDEVFEPRAVTVAWRMGDRAGVSQGLAVGERIVVAGNFLIDSESRMRMAAAAPKVKDPVCGMDVDPAKALHVEYEGKTYYFCSEHCKKQFQENPSRYVPKGRGSA